MLDLHCHIAPGLDDGAQDVRQSLEMARGLAELGFRQVAATPHLPWGSLFTDPVEFLAVLNSRLEQLRGRDCPVQLLAGAEHFSDVVPLLLEKHRPVCYPGTDNFLMELPLSGFPARLSDLLFRIEVRGLHPLLAHVERYPQVQQDIAAVDMFHARGGAVLINLTGLAGDWGREAQKTCERLLRAGKVDAVTSDLHSPEQLESVARGLQLLEELVGEQERRRLCRQVPRQLAGLDPAEKQVER